MTEPVESDLIDLATPYALNAVSVDEEAEIDRRLAAARPDVAQAFADEVRSVRETMAVLSALTSVEPPESLRHSVLAAAAADPVRELRPASGKNRWRALALAAAAVVVIGLGAVGIGLAVRPPAPTTAEQVFAAPDVQSVSGTLPGGGRATVVFSKDRNAGVLVMNDVPPPKPGTVYQMWLIDSKGPHSAGVMDTKAVAPSTTAVLPDLGSSKALAFTVEPPGGSPVPTSTPFAQLLLI